MIIIRSTVEDKRALASIPYDPKDLEDDGTDYRGKNIKKPWGYEVEKYRNKELSVWWLHVHKNMETSMHCHPEKTTLLFIFAGRAVLSTLNGNFELVEGDIVVIEPGAFHRTTASGGPVMMYELETPANKNNLVRLNDIYGRGQGYERIYA